MTPSEWYYDFLKERNLMSSDGRALYKYKTSDTEFYQLQSVLRRYPINHTDYRKWDACFALYAAEWWRRNYAEGHWSWEPILLSIQKNIDQAYQRGQLIETGFRCWKRKIYKTSRNHNDYLATVIIECGLPLQTLASERRYWLKDVIKESYADLSLISVSEAEPHEIVEQVAAQLLPNSLKKQAFYELIAQLIIEAIDLKREFKLAQQQSPIGFLDQHKPDWRETFPIQIDQVGKEFLDVLLGEVAQMKEPKTYKIALIRELIKVHELYKINATLIIPNGFYDEEDLVLPEGSIDSLPSKLNVELISSGEERLCVGVAFWTQKNGSTGYKMDVSYDLGAENSYKKWSLALVHQETQFSHELPLPGGEGMQREHPWIFTEKNGVWQLKAMASYQTRLSAAKVVAGSSWSKVGNFETLGTFAQDKEVYLLQGEGVIMLDDQKFKLVTSSDKTDNTTYLLQGNTFRYSTRNNELFLGFPHLYKINNTTLVKSKAYHEIEIRKPGQDNWHALRGDVVGSMKVRVMGAESEVIYSSRVCVLPKNFDALLRATSPTQGRVVLHGSSQFNISITGEDVKGEVQRTADGHEIELESLSNHPPKYVSLILIVSENSRIDIDLPFPASGAKFFDGNGSQLPNGSRQYLDKLHGLRLALYNPSSTQKTYSLGFELIYTNYNDNLKLIRAIKVDSYHREIPLIAYTDIIRRLFAVNDDLDTQIRIGIENGPHIRVRTYSSHSFVNKEEESISISGTPESLQQTVINIFRLDKDLEKQVVEELDGFEHTEGGQGKWHFAINSRLSGKWLIYPAAESAIKFRPVCWSILHEDSELNFTAYDNEKGQIEFFREAANIRGKTERIAALVDLVERISVDFNNPNWKEISLLWQKAKHLPLNTFDVWTAFSKSEKALIALFLNLGSDILERFNEEYPILIEAFSIEKWLCVLRRYFDRLSQLAPEFAENAVELKLKYLEDQLKLHCLAKVLGSELLGKEEKELAFGLQPALIKYEIQRLFNGDLGYQGLNQRNPIRLWPDYLTDQITLAFKGLPAEVRELLPADVSRYKRCVTYLPMLLATAASGAHHQAFSQNDIVSVFRIKEIQDFDREWFNHAFDILQCYCWMNYKNNLTNAE